TVAIAMGGENTPHAGYVSEMLIYDVTTKRLRNISVGNAHKRLEGDQSRRLSSCGLLVDSVSNTVDVFTLMWALGSEPGRTSENKHLKITHMRVPLNDDLSISTNSWQHPLDFATSVRNGHFTMAPP